MRQKSVPEKEPAVSYWGALRSWSIVAFYLTLAVGVMLVAAIAGTVYGRFL
jgi:hypothetical protein